MPKACAAMPMRPPSSVAMAILKPSPSDARAGVGGTRQSSKNTVQEWLPLDAQLVVRLSGM
jgi:hypothetical protein